MPKLPLHLSGYAIVMPQTMPHMQTFLNHLVGDVLILCGNQGEEIFASITGHITGEDRLREKWPLEITFTSTLSEGDVPSLSYAACHLLAAHIARLEGKELPFDEEQGTYILAIDMAALRNDVEDSLVKLLTLGR